MKKILYIIAVSLALSSCSNDDNDDQNATILGKWNYNQVSVTINGEFVVEEYPGNEQGCSKDFLNFRENGTVALTDYSKENTACQSEVKEGTYVMSGTSVSVAIDGGTFSGQITQLTNTTMVVMGRLGDLENVTFSFKRQ